MHKKPLSLVHLKCPSYLGGPALIRVNVSCSQAGGSLRCQGTFQMPPVSSAHSDHHFSPGGPGGRCYSQLPARPSRAGGRSWEEPAGGGWASGWGPAPGSRPDGGQSVPPSRGRGPGVRRKPGTQSSCARSLTDEGFEVRPFSWVVKCVQ